MKRDTEYPTANIEDIQDKKTRRVVREGCIVYMTPEAFLSITPAPEWWTGFSESYNRVKGRMEKNKPLDPPYIHVFYNKIDHEGRHRALAAKEIGMESIPVATLKEAPPEEEI